MKIADNGPGIDQEVLPRVFDPFYSTKDEGTGLGLAISYRILEDIGARIDVESRENHGTAFTVTLSQYHSAEIEHSESAT